MQWCSPCLRLWSYSPAAVPAQAQTPTVLYDFMNNTSDACQPEGNLVQGRDGYMYGIGVDDGFGGCGLNRTGAVYKISTTGVESVFRQLPGELWSTAAPG